MLIAAATALAIAAAVAGLADSFWTVLLMMLLFNAAQGVGGPVQRAYLHTIAPSAQRATVASAVSLVGGAGGSSDSWAWAGSRGQMRLPVDTSRRA